MTPGERYEIAILSDLLEEARATFEYHSMLNVYGKSEQERRKMAAEYHLAQTEYMEAAARLNRAKVRAASRAQ